jgi:oligopeptide/dipeptide ABC transporter ATP-binding protein
MLNMKNNLNDDIAHPTEGSAALLRVSALSKSYSVRQSMLSVGLLQAVDDVSFSVAPGQTVALVGESGCGKSTIGKCILRLVDIDSGEILYEGQPIHHLSQGAFRPYRQKMQMVFQNPLASFNPQMAIASALADPLRLRDDLSPSDYRDEAARLLEAVKLSPDFLAKHPNEMSGGQLQRVGVARALASRPSFLFLDEPTSSLDLSVRGQIINLLLDLQEEFNLAYLFVSHDLRVVQIIADYVLVMYLGHILEECSNEELFRRPLHPYTKGLMEAISLEAGQERREYALRGDIMRRDIRDLGCRLYPRCQFVQPRCANEQQALRELATGHFVRCWRASELEGTGVVPGGLSG